MNGVSTRRSENVWLALALAVLSTVTSMAVISQLPVSILASARLDDAWFWHRAASIGGGAWLGAYDQVTLMKGAGYPIFLALANSVGASITVAQAALYALATGMLAWAFHRTSGRLWLSVTLLLLVQWQPAAFAWGRVLRDNISAAQVLLVLACVMHFVASLRAGNRGLGWMGAAGLVGGWFWCTREDGVWILPGLIVLIAAILVSHWRNPREMRRVFSGTAMLIAGFCVVPTLVMASNKLHYGAFVTTDVNRGGFAAAMSALQRVRVGEVVPYAPVPEKVRNAAYNVSPTFARLRPVLEDASNPWLHSNCTFYRSACGDYAGGWFIWALRDAAASIEVYPSASESDAFYKQVAADISKACDEGQLHCVSEGLGLMPPVDQFQWQNATHSSLSFLRLLLWQEIRLPAVPSHVDHPEIAQMWRYVGEPAMPDAAQMLNTRVSGWFRGEDDDWLRGICKSSGERFPIERRASPDIALHFNDPSAAMNRFVATFPVIDGCAIEFTSGAGRLALSSIERDGQQYTAGGELLVIDALVPGIDASGSKATVPPLVRDNVGRIYEVVMPTLAISGLLAFFGACFVALRARRIDTLLVVAMAAWCMIICRIALLVLVDISSFPAVKVHYLQPAFPLLVAAAVASWGCLLNFHRPVSALGRA